MAEALPAANVETLLRLLTALSQRQDTVRQLATQLATGVTWRSPDGALAVSLPLAQQDELVDFIRQYLDESDVIIATARTLLPTKT